MREPQRLLTRLNPIAVDWQNSVRVTGDVLRAEDVAAGLAGLKQGPYLLTLYLWSGDTTVEHELYLLIFNEVKELAEKRNWKCKNDEVRLLLLIKMALLELKKIKNCNPCKGTGVKTHDVCSNCNGIGKRRRTQAEYARACGVKISNWKKCWDQKYSEVLLIIIDWENIGVEHLVSRL